MRSPFRLLALAVLFTVNCSLLTKTQAQTPKTYTSSEILLGLKKLNVLGSVLYIAAHPDDENTRLLAYLANERLLETGYLSCTRGDGGQNLIGPELREGLGVIRTQELLAARRLDGARQFFTRANDFGFSKTADETFTIWDREQVLADMVWVIRQRRPDVLITRFPPDARAGHGHHTASAILAADAFTAAGDPKRFPEQLQYVQPWQPKRLLWNTGSFFVKPGDDLSGYLKLDAGGYNPLLGQSYGEIAARSRSNHRSQGFGSAATRGEALEYFQAVKGEKATKDLFEGVDLTWGRVGGGRAISYPLAKVLREFDPAKPAASVPGLLTIRLYLQSAMMGSDISRLPQADLYWCNQKLLEIESLIRACLGLHLEATAAEATAVSGEALAVKLEVVNRGPIPLRVLNFFTDNPRQDSALAAQSTIPLPKEHRATGRSRGAMTAEVLDPSGCVVEQVLAPGTSLNKAFALPLYGSRQHLLSENMYVQTLQPPVKGAIPVSQPYWLREPGTVGMYKLPGALVNTPQPPVSNLVPGAELGYWWLRELGTVGMYQLPGGLANVGRPENEPPAAVRVKLLLDGKDEVGKVTSYIIGFDIPIQYKHTDPVLGELYQPLAVVPAVMVNLPPARSYVFADAQPKTVPVTLRAGRAGVSGSLALALPAGWRCEPATAPFALAAKDEELTVNFQVQPGPGAAPGRAELRASATVAGQAFSRGLQTIQYPHIPTQFLFPEAVAPLVKLDLKRRGQNVAYLMGAGDEVPDALRQIGYTVTLLDPQDLTAARLKNFDALVVGIRAYNTVDRLKTQQPEILKYIEQGGNVVVQYVVARGAVLPQIGPYPLTLSNDRVTVEGAEVTFLKPQHPLLNAPNKITAQDFTGWVQEQGLYYPSAWDPKYQPIISSHDPGEPAKESAILVADYGKGHYIYTGLSLFRELPAGVPGAYRILANLVSYGK